MERLEHNTKGQCFDLANFYYNYVVGSGSLAGQGAKDIPFQNNFKGIAKVHKNTPAFKAQAGDIVVFSGKYGQGKLKPCI